MSYACHYEAINFAYPFRPHAKTAVAILKHGPHDQTHTDPAATIARRLTWRAMKQRYQIDGKT
jgi:hypothetical protein